MPEYVIYEGPLFTLEWYYNEQEVSQALDFFDKLTAKEQDKLFYLVKRIGDAGKINDKTKFRHEGDGIYAFKPKPNRFLCFFIKDKKIIVTNAFVKKCQKLPKTEKMKALDAKREYTNRVEKGEYYE